MLSDKRTLRNEIDAAAAKYRASSASTPLDDDKASSSSTRSAPKIELPAPIVASQALDQSKFQRLPPAPMDDQAAAEKRRKAALATMLKL